MEELERHVEMNKKIALAIEKMEGLRMNIGDIDAQYAEMIKNKGKVEDDDAKLIEKAAAASKYEEEATKKAKKIHDERL